MRKIYGIIIILIMDILSLSIFLPIIGVIPILFLRNERLIKGFSLLFSIIPLIGSILLLLAFDKKNPLFQFVVNIPWIPLFKISYHIGLDGMSLPLFILTSILSPVSILVSFNIKNKVRGYFISFLILETGMLGVFASLNLFLFYIFWELVLIPMYLIIGIWGGEKRVYAAIKFILYTAIGSVLMLIGIIWIFIQTNTFDITELIGHQEILQNAKFIWILLFFGFAVKVPIFPFHTWLPDAHTEAPTAGSILLAGVLLKLGTYGLLRVNFGILPEVTLNFSYFLAILGLINIIYGAFAAMAQKDLKRMIACSSISHMGYCLLGMSSFTTNGFNGAVLQMFNHGIITGSLFLLVGVIYDRAHHREILGFGGIAKVVPSYCAIMGIAVLASIGLPGLSGFVSEFLCFIGAFDTFPWITGGAVFGVLIGAIYMLWMYRQVFFGSLNEKYKDLSDLDIREWISIIPLMIMVFLIGLYPKIALDLMNSSLSSLSFIFYE
ncbi:MAG: NADH-quinone oxidoreductase subunit M [bacterium]